MPNNNKQIQIEKHIKSVIDILNIKTTDSTKDTPKRIAKMLINELFIGLQEDKFPKYKMFKVNKKINEAIVVENISIYSICEHHFLPFIGTATFKYIPHDKIIGLSKIPRIIDFLARKPQLQERLTDEIFTTFVEILKTKDISIELKCEHLCAKMRGIKDNCIMTTSKHGGCFTK